MMLERFIMFIKIRKYLLIFVSAAILFGCGNGKCVTNDGGTSTNLINLTMSAPSQYPAGIAVTVPVVVTNTESTGLTNLVYSIANNTTKADLTITPASAQECSSIAGNDTCTLQVDISNNSVPGSFSVAVTGNKVNATNTSTVLSGAVSALNSSSTIVSVVKVDIGLTAVPTNNQSGLNGVNLYFNDVVSLPGNTAGTVIVTMVVTSTNVGAFNTLDLVDSNGTSIPYLVLTGNSGSNLDSLPKGSVITLAVSIPAGATQLSFFPSLKMNGSPIINGQTNTPSTINILRPSTPQMAGLTMSPS